MQFERVLFWLYSVYNKVMVVIPHKMINSRILIFILKLDSYDVDFVKK